MHETDFCFYNIESPAAEATSAVTRTRVRGWIVPKPQIHLVDVRAKQGSVILPAVHGFPRIDLAAYFYPEKPWLPAEFTLDLDLKTGPVSLQFEALDLQGEWRHFHTLLITIVENPSPPLIVPDPLTIKEFSFLFGQELRQLSGRENCDPTVMFPYPRAIRHTHEPFFGYLVEPGAASPALFGQADVVGWLFHARQSITRVIISSDLLIFHELDYGGRFAGVENLFPNHAHASNCRFSGVVGLLSTGNPTKTLRVYAELDDGSIHLCLASEVLAIFTEELKVTPPRLSFLDFCAQWKLFKRKLINRSVILPIPRELRREFWSARHINTRTLCDRPYPLIRFSAAKKVGQKLHLLLITHNLNYEGAPLLFLEYARYLVHHHDAEIQVLSGQDGPLKAAFAAVSRSLSIINTSQLFSVQSAASFRRQLAKVTTDLEWGKFDLVVANTIASFWGIQLAIEHRVRSLLYIHESTSPSAFKGIPRHLLPLVGECIACATAVSFNTPATEKYYTGIGTGANFHLNPAWIDLASITKFCETHSREQLRMQLKIRNRVKLVINVGSVCSRKGQHDFLRAAHWLWQRDPTLASNCHFFMIGGRDTNYQRLLERDLAQTGLKNVTIVSETSQAFEYFLAADLFVCTSYEESFPRVVLEAMAFAVPIVSTDVHGIPYMLKAGKEAHLVKPGDTAKLVDAMIDLLSDTSKAVAYATRSKNRVSDFDAAKLLPQHASFTKLVATAAI